MNRLLSSVRQRLWRIPRISRSENTSAEELEGPEPPNGFLFNEKPLLPGERRQKESWENVWVYGMTLNLLLVIGIVAFKPDTSILLPVVFVLPLLKMLCVIALPLLYSVSGWARTKAIERLSNEDSETDS